MKVKPLGSHRISDLSHIFLLAILLLTAILAQAQNTSYTTVKLNNGMTVKGELVNLVQDEYVELKTPLGSSMKIMWKDIKEIDFTSAQASAPAVGYSKTFPQSYAYNDSTYYLSLGGGFPFGLDSYGDPSLGFSVSATIGKSFGPKLNVGAFVGYDIYQYPNTGIIPLGFEIRGRTKPIGLTPFYFLQAGYGLIGFSEYDRSWRVGEASGGFFASPGVGIMHKRKPHSAWFLQFGIKMQNSHAEYWDTIWDGRPGGTTVFIKEDITFRRVDLKFGYIFD